MLDFKCLFKVSLFSLFVFLSINNSFANIYKCFVSGKTIYTSIPCTSSSTPLIVSTISPSSTTTSNPVAVTSISPTTTITSTSLPANALITDGIFKSTSFWYAPIPATVALHPNSENFVKEFVRQKTAYYNNVIINTYSYSSPVYIADGNLSTVPVGYNNCQHKTWVDPVYLNMMTPMPIPKYAQQSAGSDHEMVIYQPSTHTMWEMWGVVKNSTGNWYSCWGGRILNTSDSLGINQKSYGTTATGLPFLGGQVTAEELARGEIKHAIGIALVDVEKSSIYSWPANRSDGWNPYNVPNRIAEGQRFRLNPSVNVDSLPMTKAGKVIAKAAQKYGFVVWDKAGSISIRAQNALSYTALGKPNPYPALYENKPSYAVLNGFPWDQLQFLPINYGKPL